MWCWNVPVLLIQASEWMYPGIHALFSHTKYQISWIRIVTRMCGVEMCQYCWFRHLNGCILEGKYFSRPHLMITDAFNANYNQSRRRVRDEQLMSMYNGYRQWHRARAIFINHLSSDNFSFQKNGIKRGTCWKTIGFLKNQ